MHKEPCESQFDIELNTEQKSFKSPIAIPINHDLFSSLFTGSEKKISSQFFCFAFFWNSLFFIIVALVAVFYPKPEAECGNKIEKKKKEKKCFMEEKFVQKDFFLHCSVC